MTAAAVRHRLLQQPGVADLIADTRREALADALAALDGHGYSSTAHDRIRHLLAMMDPTGQEPLWGEHRPCARCGALVVWCQDTPGALEQHPLRWRHIPSDDNRPLHWSFPTAHPHRYAPSQEDIADARTGTITCRWPAEVEAQDRAPYPTGSGVLLGQSTTAEAQRHLHMIEDEIAWRVESRHPWVAGCVGCDHTTGPWRTRAGAAQAMRVHWWRVVGDAVHIKDRVARRT